MRSHPKLWFGFGVVATLAMVLGVGRIAISDGQAADTPDSFTSHISAYMFYPTTASLPITDAEHGALGALSLRCEDGGGDITYIANGQAEHVVFDSSGAKTSPPSPTDQALSFSNSAPDHLTVHWTNATPDHNISFDMLVEDSNGAPGVSLTAIHGYVRTSIGAGCIYYAHADTSNNGGSGQS